MPGRGLRAHAPGRPARALHHRRPGLARALALRRGDAGPQGPLRGRPRGGGGGGGPRAGAARLRGDRGRVRGRCPRVLDPEQAMAPGAPVIHDQADASGIKDAAAQPGRRDRGRGGRRARTASREAERVFEDTYRVPYVQQSSIEPHITITWLDEDHRLMVRTSTQVPFHVRRIIAPLLGIPIRRIRVIKPRIGGGFGGKQEILIEDLCGMLTLRTGRPGAARVHARGGADRRPHPPSADRDRQERRQGRPLHRASRCKVLENTGAYGTHALTVMSVTGNRALSLYRCPNLRYEAHAVYTNLAVAGAFRGYGCPQGFFALESHVDEVAAALGRGPAGVPQAQPRAGGRRPAHRARCWARDARASSSSSAPAACPRPSSSGRKAIGWAEKRKSRGRSTGPVRRGVGMAIVMQASGIPGVDMGAASIKMNEDGSFNLLMGATDIGTGSDTMFCQVAAEALGVPVEKIIPYSSDTDMTPFDPGAYASSTTYISGRAVEKAARLVLRADRGGGRRACWRRTRRTWSLHERQGLREGRPLRDLRAGLPVVALPEGPVPDHGHRVAHVLRLAAAVRRRVRRGGGGHGDGPGARAEGGGGGGLRPGGEPADGRGPGGGRGRAVDRLRALRAHALRRGRAHGSSAPSATTRSPPRPTCRRSSPSWCPPTSRPGPFGAKAIAEIPINGPAPAIANAVFHATGVRVRELPLTPERVWEALAAAKAANR